MTQESFFLSFYWLFIYGVGLGSGTGVISHPGSTSGYGLQSGKHL